LGFVPIAEGQLGNGDHFGFYWPIGQEDREPLVVEVWHDDWSLQPKFSRVARFIEALGDEDSPPDTPSLSDDPDSPLALFLAAKEAMRDGPGGAIAHLQSAVARLPEFRDAQALLAAQYRRVGDHANSVRAAIAAIISPGCFGAAPVQLARWLSAQTSCPPEIEADPVWRVRERLTLRFGGVKENDQYDLLGHAIDEYIGRGQYGRATTLMQMYAQEMARETISFRDRYSYAEAAFLARQVEVAKLGGSSRLLATSKSRSN
jgi:hypothetical protein